jgi:hypothetical protein
MRSFRAPFCSAGSITLADRAVESAPAWADLFTATTMRRDMGMTYWLQMSEAT